MTIALRPYQVEAIEAVRTAAKAGRRRIIIHLPTGVGKTLTALSMAKAALDRGNRVLWLAHRNELITQPIRAATLLGIPDASVGVVKAERDEYDRGLVFATVQSATWRLDRLLARTFPLVIVDEAHHASASSWERILKAIPETSVVIGLTATPDRGDGLPLDEQFPGGVAYSLPLPLAVRQGWLVDFRAEVVELAGLDLDDVKRDRGDFQAGDLARAMEGVDAPKAIAEAYVRLGTVVSEHGVRRRRALVFTPTVAFAEQTAQALRDAGVRAVAVSGDTDPEERASVIRRFASGEIEAVANAALWTEGFDEPSVECIVVARPTKSKSLYLQMVGRGLRRSPGKRDCLVIDLAGSSKRHTPVMAPVLVGLPVDFRVAGGLVAAADSEDGKKKSKRGALRQDYEIDEAAESTEWAHWVALDWPRGSLAASAPGRLLVIVHPAKGIPETEEFRWHVTMWRDSARDQVTREPVWRELAIGIGDDIVRKTEGGKVAKKGVAWRDAPASDKQLELLRKWSVPMPVMNPHEPGLTRGEAADLFTLALARKKVKMGGIG